METKRYLELLAYASICFDRCADPFATRHLVKKNVRADECRDLSATIANIIEQDLDTTFDPEEVKEAIEKAKREFAETQ